MKPYIFTERNGIHIIDLQKTSKAIDQVYSVVRDTVAEGGTVLFVGTKRQAQETIQNEAMRAGMPYVTARWLGGMLTNWRTIRQRVNELEQLERMRDSGEFSRITKKEGLILSRKIERLDMLLSGIRSMSALPDLLFVVDVHREATAIHEANLLNIPVLAMVDTNCDPSNVDYIIPSNDDAIRAIKLVVGKIADAAVEGRAMRKEEVEEDVSARAAARLVEDQELSDEELLGEATLAKLSSRGRETEEDIAEEEDAFEEFEDEISDEEEELDEFFADEDEGEDELDESEEDESEEDESEEDESEEDESPEDESEEDE